MKQRNERMLSMSAGKMRTFLPFYLMLIPGAIYFILFKYAPLWGILISFKNYKPIYTFASSEWVGLKYYIQFFNRSDFLRLLRNTCIIGLNNILIYFPMPVILALMIHGLGNNRFTKSVQAIVYIPHFISWVVVVALTNSIFGDLGIINSVMRSLGMESQGFLYSESWFRPLILMQTIWKECGWGTIIFTAALTAVNADLYEAARMDGAGRLAQLWHVTLPAIKSTIIVMFILRVGRFLDTGFEQIYLMVNSMNRSIGDVFDTFIYEQGILNGRFSYSMAISTFKSVLGMVLVLITDRIAKMVGEDGIL